ncbi:AAA family ATPase [Actinomycetospora atypica]|uniref:AAA family ATPase n=1 Tax=Actinomycetospora atypica TaxID=1290095 RepID=A0ABV9YDZ8_9PSEU
MKIEELRVRRFKSLYNTATTLQNFSVLTGPNGSGKSNFTAVIDFLGEAYRFGLDYAVGRAGGIDAIAYRRTRRTTVPISLGLTFRVDANELEATLGSRKISEYLDEDRKSLWFDHDFEIKPSRDLESANFQVSKESVRLYGGIGKPRDLLLNFESAGSSSSTSRESTLEFDSDKLFGSASLSDIYKKRLNAEDVRAEIAESSDPTNLFFNRPAFSVPPFRELRMLLNRLNVYRLNAAACRNPGVLTPTASLSKDGGNLPGVVARLRRRRNTSGTWDRILSSMVEIFPDLQDIDTTESASTGINLRFHEEGVGRPWSALEVSDGTIQYLAMLCVLFDRSGPALVLEEPENTLHSWLLRLLLQKCREDESRQVLLTTHSPVALKAVSPDEVLLASKRNGRTSVRPLAEIDPDSKRIYEESGIDVFEQYDSGYLPETIPGSGVQW